MRNKHSRRGFLKRSLAVTAGGGVPYFAWSPQTFANASANDRLGIGCIGMGSMGTGDATGWADSVDMAFGHADFGDIVAVCDVDARPRRSGQERPADRQRQGRRLRRLPQSARPQGHRRGGIATPDHWHVKIAIEALQAGKHVFCQKPLTLTLEENQLIRNACKKYGDRVFAVGTQQRSTATLVPPRHQHGAKGPVGRHPEDHRRHQRRQ